MSIPDPVTGAVALPVPEARALLRGLLDRAQRAGDGGLFVFDLDSTLLDNHPRQALLMREYGELRNVAALSGARAEHWEGWDARIAMRNAGLDEAGIDRHFDDFRAYWRERFFTSEYCRVDVPIAGAPEYVRAVRDAGARVVYVTGRHEGMRAGTEESFREPAFPMPDGDGVQLFMKPSIEETDDDYKNRAYARLREIGDVVAAFDNEPTHINGYRAAFPDAVCVHLATDHSMRDVRVVAGISSISDFSAFLE